MRVAVRVNDLMSFIVKICDRVQMFYINVLILYFVLHSQFP